MPTLNKYILSQSQRGGVCFPLLSISWSESEIERENSKLGFCSCLFLVLNQKIRFATINNKSWPMQYITVLRTYKTFLWRWSKFVFKTDFSSGPFKCKTSGCTAVERTSLIQIFEDFHIFRYFCVQWER